MGLGVIAEQVSSIDCFAHEIGAGANKLTDNKESRGHGVLVEQIKQSRCHGGIWTIVKRESQSLRARRVTQRPPKSREDGGMAPQTLKADAALTLMISGMINGHTFAIILIQDSPD